MCCTSILAKNTFCFHQFFSGLHHHTYVPPSESSAVNSSRSLHQNSADEILNQHETRKGKKYGGSDYFFKR